MGLLLDYAFSTDPGPLQVSIAGSSTTGRINVSISDPTGTIYCKQLTIAVPLGDDGAALAAAANVPLSSINKSTWSVVDVVLGEVPDGSSADTFAKYTFKSISTDPSDWKIGSDGLVPSLLAIVNEAPGRFAYAIQELSGTDPQALQDNSGKFELEKVPPRFYVHNLVAALPASPTVPATEFALGASPLLQWEGNGTWYELFEKGKPAPIYSGTATHFTLTDGLHTDTTFVLAASVTGDPDDDTPTTGYETVVIYDTITLTVSNPALTPTSVSASGDVKGAVVRAIGAVIGDSVHATGAVEAGSVQAVGAVTAASVHATAAVVADSVQATKALVGDSVHATGAVVAGSVQAMNAVTGDSVDALGTLTGAKLSVTGAGTVGALSAASVTATGNGIFGAVSSDNGYGGRYIKLTDGPSSLSFIANRLTVNGQGAALIVESPSTDFWSAGFTNKSEPKGDYITGVISTVHGKHSVGYATNGQSLSSSGSAMLTHLETKAGHRVVTSPLVLEEEVQISGSAQLSGGRASVALDDDAVDLILHEGDTRYLVLVTPTGQCGGIAVVEKTPTGFVVEELGGGTSDAGFDWLLISRKPDALGAAVASRLPDRLPEIAELPPRAR